LSSEGLEGPGDIKKWAQVGTRACITWSPERSPQARRRTHTNCLGSRCRAATTPFEVIAVGIFLLGQTFCGIFPLKWDTDVLHRLGNTPHYRNVGNRHTGRNVTSVQEVTSVHGMGSKRCKCSVSATTKVLRFDAAIVGRGSPFTGGRRRRRRRQRHLMGWCNR